MTDEGVGLHAFSLRHEAFERFFRALPSPSSPPLPPSPPNPELSERVFLVSWEWHTAFVKWLTDEKCPLFSCWRDYHNLLNKRVNGLEFGRDFSVEPYDLLPKLISHFREQPPRDLIVRYWAKSFPGDSTPQFFPTAVKVRVKLNSQWKTHLPQIGEMVVNPHWKVSQLGIIDGKWILRDLPRGNETLEIGQMIEILPQPWSLEAVKTQETKKKDFLK
jgi:hypothetical protein